MKKIDSLLKRAELFEKLAVYGDRKSFLKALSQDASLSGGLGGSQMSGLEMETPPGPTGPFKSIPVETQKELNQLLVDPVNPVMSPLLPDGKLGPETIAAALLFRNKFNMPATVENIKAKALEVRNPSLTTKTPF
jgi:hypothetical protein